MATLRNDRSGRTVETRMSNAEVAAAFAGLPDQRDSWLWFWVHQAVNDAQDRAAAAHWVQAGGTDPIRFLGDMFLVATGYGLKRPMVRLHFQDRRFKIYLSARGTLCLKTGALAEGTHDPVGDEEYAGCWSNGRWLPRRDDASRYVRPLLPAEAAFMERLAADPVRFLAECSKDMDRCCYCAQQLDDERSKTVGYGPVCAKRWGLPWGARDGQRVPSFAESYSPQAAGFLQAVRENPRSEDAWGVFGDWLEERGLPRCKCPEGAVRIART